MQIRNPILLTILFAATISAATSAGVIVPGNPSAGQHPLEIRKQQISVTVRDQVARVTVDEQFENHTDLPLEGTYLMPLPESAAVSGFATWIDGVRVESRIEEKSAAKASYDAAKKDGAAPALLEQGAHSFKMHVDGIPPRGTKRVEASYAQILPYDSGEVTLRLPRASRLRISGRSRCASRSPIRRRSSRTKCSLRRRCRSSRRAAASS